MVFKVEWRGRKFSSSQSVGEFELAVDSQWWGFVKEDCDKDGYACKERTNACPEGAWVEILQDAYAEKKPKGNVPKAFFEEVSVCGANFDGVFVNAANGGV